MNTADKFEVIASNEAIKQAGAEVLAGLYNEKTVESAARDMGLAEQRKEQYELGLEQAAEVESMTQEAATTREIYKEAIDIADGIKKLLGNFRHFSGDFARVDDFQEEGPYVVQKGEQKPFKPNSYFDPTIVTVYTDNVSASLPLGKIRHVGADELQVESAVRLFTKEAQVHHYFHQKGIFHKRLTSSADDKSLKQAGLIVCTKGSDEVELETFTLHLDDYPQHLDRVDYQGNKQLSSYKVRAQEVAADLKKMVPLFKLAEIEVENLRTRDRDWD